MKLVPLEASYYYHFFNRGNNKECIFIEEANYSYFLKLVKKYIVPIAEIYSYCLLPNHFHLIIKIKENKELPKSIKLHQVFSNLFNAYTKAFNKKYHRTGSLFQKHPKRIKIVSQEYLKNLIVYVNTNPTHHSILNYSVYKFSSYKALISRQPTLIMRDEVINMFYDTENFKAVLYKKRVNIELIKELLLE